MRPLIGKSIKIDIILSTHLRFESWLIFSYKINYVWDFERRLIIIFYRIILYQYYIKKKQIKKVIPSCQWTHFLVQLIVILWSFACPITLNKKFQNKETIIFRPTTAELLGPSSPPHTSKVGMLLQVGLCIYSTNKLLLVVTGQSINELRFLLKMCFVFG